MLYRNYGKDKLKISAVGLGGISIKGLGVKESSRIINLAIDKGVNYFDVAPGYGDAQYLMGKGLKNKINNVFLACKSKFRTAKESKKDLEESLMTLGTDHFDLYQLHGMKTKEDYEIVTGKYGALRTLEDAKEQGKINHIGFSCHSIEVAKLLLNNYKFDSILIPINWKLILNHNFGEEIINQCKRLDVSVLALKVMADRLWKNKEERDSSYKNCWYKPLSETKIINLAVKFALSREITSFLPPGDPKLFLKGVEAVESYSKINEEEISILKNYSKISSSIGSREEIFI
jgi:predicted aldo/keto reductase-like oxidoreductase